jgi:hypothetical protein
VAAVSPERWAKEGRARRPSVRRLQPTPRIRARNRRRGPGQPVRRHGAGSPRPFHRAAGHPAQLPVHVRASYPVADGREKTDPARSRSGSLGVGLPEGVRRRRGGARGRWRLSSRHDHQLDVDPLALPPARLTSAGRWLRDSRIGAMAERRPARGDSVLDCRTPRKQTWHESVRPRAADEASGTARARRPGPRGAGWSSCSARVRRIASVTGGENRCDRRRRGAAGSARCCCS